MSDDIGDAEESDQAVERTQSGPPSKGASQAPGARPVPQQLRMMHIGPLPPPAMLREYEEVIPGFSEKLQNAFLAEGEHRRQGDRAQWKARAQGMRFALTVVLVFGGVAFYAFHLGYAWQAVAILGADLLSLVGAFITARVTAPSKRVEQEPPQS